MKADTQKVAEDKKETNQVWLVSSNMIIIFQECLDLSPKIVR